MTRKKVIGDELDARAKATGYQRVHTKKKTVIETVINI
jgi:hypothetical protein